jgi:pimeloyl-ACP methyl ester carboxylesterase
MDDSPSVVQIDGVAIPYRVMGAGAPIVCVELPLNPFPRLTPLQRSLASGNRVYVIDLRPAVGRVDQPPRDLLDFAATTLLKILDALAIDSCTLIGTFMAGAVAMEVARRAPARVNHLVVIGSLGLVRLPVTWLMWSITGFFRLPGIPALYRFKWFRAAIESQDRLFLAHLREKQLFYQPARPLARLEELYEHYATPPNEAAGWALLWCIRQMRYDALKSRLAEVSCPTLILHGTHDVWVPAQYARELQTRLPNARLEWIPETRHMPELEKTDVAVGQILPFLAESAPARRPVVSAGRGGGT